MRSLIPQLIGLGLATGITFGMGVTAFEICYLHGWRGYNLDVLGTAFPGKVDVTYSVAGNAPFNFGLGCLFGCLAWGIAAVQSRTIVWPELARAKTRSRVLSWIVAGLIGLLFAVTWASLNPIALNPPLPIPRLLRTVVIVGVGLLGFSIVHWAWCVDCKFPGCQAEPSTATDGSRDAGS